MCGKQADLPAERMSLVSNESLEFCLKHGVILSAAILPIASNYSTSMSLGTLCKSKAVARLKRKSDSQKDDLNQTFLKSSWALRRNPKLITPSSKKLFPFQPCFFNNVDISHCVHEVNWINQDWQLFYGPFGFKWRHKVHCKHFFFR